MGLDSRISTYSDDDTRIAERLTTATDSRTEYTACPPACHITQTRSVFFYLIDHPSVDDNAAHQSTSVSYTHETTGKTSAAKMRCRGNDDCKVRRGEL